VNAIVPAFDCRSEGIQFEAALTCILGLVAEKLGVEVVPLAACVARVIAAPRQARLELPGFAQFAMDGYAV
jgi:molybdopterin biosynthesis enzyme